MESIKTICSSMIIFAFTLILIAVMCFGLAYITNYCTVGIQLRQQELKMKQIEVGAKSMCLNAPNSEQCRNVFY